MVLWCVYLRKFGKVFCETYIPGYDDIPGIPVFTRPETDCLVSLPNLASDPLEFGGEILETALGRAFQGAFRAE